jgi:hypothetical protein
MNKLKNIGKIVKERISGFFLLIFAGLILIGLSANFHRAESKNGQELAVSQEQSSPEGQTLGEADSVSDYILPEEDPGDSVLQEDSSEKTEGNASVEKEAGKIDKADLEKVRCEDLKKLLSKYCGKNYNISKCRSYLLETKDLSKKGGRCRSLYKKYHFVPKNEEKKDSQNSSSDSDAGSGDVKEEATLTINYSGSKADDKYVVAIGTGMTVMDMMKKAKENGGLSYDESVSWPGYIQEINSTKEDMSKNIFWMLYSNGGMASEGASTLKVKSGDKIEWRYAEVSW